MTSVIPTVPYYLRDCKLSMLLDAVLKPVLFIIPSKSAGRCFARQLLVPCFEADAVTSNLDRRVSLDRTVWLEKKARAWS